MDFLNNNYMFIVWDVILFYVNETAFIANIWSKFTFYHISFLWICIYCPDFNNVLNVIRSINNYDDDILIETRFC